jgi:hypothetical protein
MSVCSLPPDADYGPIILAAILGLVLAVAFMATVRRTVPLMSDHCTDHPDIVALRNAIEANRKAHRPTRHLQRRLTDRLHDQLRKELRS